MVPLKLVKPDSSQEIIEMLEKALVRAKNGDVRGIALAYQLIGNETATVFSLGKDGDIAHLISAMEMLKLRLLGVTH